MYARYMMNILIYLTIDIYTATYKMIKETKKFFIVA